MKALFFDEPKKPIVSQVQSPSITANEVMIRSRRVGICHSDYELLAGQYIIPISYPVIPGHEWVGEVVEVGKNVTGLKRGDRVVGECVIKTPERIHHFGFSMDGANREYFPARPEWLHKLPDAVDDAKGALIEPFTCGFYAVLRNGAPERFRDGRGLGRRNHRSGHGGGGDRHGRPRDRHRPGAAASGHRQTAGRRRDRRPVGRRSDRGGAGTDPRRRRSRRRGVRPFRLARQRLRLRAAGGSDLDGRDQHRPQDPGPNSARSR